MPTRPSASRTAYQNKRLRIAKISLESNEARMIIHFCVDLTIEKPRFSLVWKLRRPLVSLVVGGHTSKACALFLCPLNIHQHPVQAEYALLKRARLLRNLAGLGRCIASRLALDHDVKVDELIGKGGHVVLEAEAIFANGVCCQDIVALALAPTVEKDLLVRVLHFEVNVK